MSKHVLIAGGFLLLAAPALAFDGSRKGFVFGLGVGGGGTSFKQELSGLLTGETETETNGAFATDLELGWGANEQLLIYYSNHVNWFGITNVFNDKVTIASGVTNAAVSYFLKPDAPSGVVGGGIGASAWNALSDGQSSSSVGFGIWAGGGYEFSRHWMALGKLTYGNPSDEEGGVKLETKATGFSLSINYLAY